MESGFFVQVFLSALLLLLSPARKSGSAIARYIVDVRGVRGDALPRWNSGWAFAAVAEVVQHGIFNPDDAGSIPAGGND